jgi:hypothetical protein
MLLGLLLNYVRNWIFDKMHVICRREMGLIGGAMINAYGN